MLNFLQTLLSKDESEIDSAIVCGLLSLVAMVMMSGYVVFVDHSMWNPLNFATGTATIIGSVAGGKTMRDRWSGNPAPGIDTVSEEKVDDPK